MKDLNPDSPRKQIMIFNSKSLNIIKHITCNN